MLKLVTLHRQFGQSAWLDYIDRPLLTGGALRSLVGEGLRGVTSNPTIFHEAITGSDAYDDDVRDLVQAGRGMDDAAVYEWLTVQDARTAADILEPVYDESGGIDGYVSLEVSPHLAYAADRTVEAARHLWRMVDRPNLMIKVPGTEPGLLAVEKLLGEGVNVNVTLLFSLEHYRAAARAYARGLAVFPDPGNVASVASFFLSRIDTKVDALLEGIGTDEALGLRGQAAIALAKVAYREFKAYFHGPEFAGQSRRGARPQRLLWASTGTKNPDYSDVLYVEELVGADTVSTMPRATLDAFLAHGEARAMLEIGTDRAERQLADLAAVGVNLDKVSAELEREGVTKFTRSYDALLEALGEKRLAMARQFAGS